MKRKLFWKLFTGLAKGLFILFAGLMATLGVTWSSDGHNRPEWNQTEALRRVQAVIAQEEAKNFAWDKIDWLTDPNEAAMRAQRENRPIFLYFFLKKDIGPKAAPS
jgi:hypothetical protein